MGQRLNIEIKRKRDNKELANCYYHWSAYTESACRLTLEILENIIDYKKETDDKDVMRAIKLLQSTGAGVESEDYDKLTIEQAKYCKLGDNRNLGLISFTKENMETTRQWEEGRVEIYLSDKENIFDNIKDTRVSFDVFYGESREMIEEDYKDEIESGELDLDNLIEFDIDFDNMTIEDVKEFYSRINEIENDYCGKFKIKGQENIYCCIY